MAYLRTPEAAKYLGVGKSTLERKRFDGSGPLWRKLGGKIVVYSTDDLDDWANKAVYLSTSEPVAA